LIMILKITALLLNLAMLHDRWANMRPERPSRRSLPCSPKFLL